MKYTFEQLKEAEEKLPKNIREALSSSKFISTVQDIGKKHNLHIDKMGELSDEISLVMLGFTHPSDFVKNIKQRLEVDEKTANNITMEINEKIFKPIKETLLSIHGDKVEQLNGKSVEQREQKNIVEEKLGQPFKIPKTETEHTGKETPSTTNKGYKDVDPYREPLE